MLSNDGLVLVVGSKIGVVCVCAGEFCGPHSSDAGV